MQDNRRNEILLRAIKKVHVKQKDIQLEPTVKGIMFNEQINKQHCDYLLKLDRFCEEIQPGYSTGPS